MFIGKNRNSKMDCYNSYIIELKTKTKKIGKVIVLIGVPAIAYFVYQDIFLVKLPKLFLSRLIFIVPFSAYIWNFLTYKKNGEKYVELFHSILLLSILLMSVSMVNYVVSLEASFGVHSRHALNALIVNFFVVFVFAGISMRWLHIIISVPIILLTILILGNNNLAPDVKYSFFSNVILISIILIFRAFQQEHVMFDEFCSRAKLKKELEINSQITEDLKQTLKINCELHAELELLARYDNLTNTYSRNAGMDLLELEIERCKSGGLFTVVFIDVDGLKAINDSYGHAEGDELLKRIVFCTKDRMSSSDYIIRLGGDEFVIVLLDCVKMNAKKMIEDVKVRLACEDKPYKLDFSYGFSSYDGQCDLCIDELLSNADKNMYMDKVNKKISIN